MRRQLTGQVLGTSQPANYELSVVVPTEANTVRMKVRPRETYKFEAVARVDKGLVGGITWVRSQRTEFSTTGSTSDEHRDDVFLQVAMVVGLLAICVLGNV